MLSLLPNSSAEAGTSLNLAGLKAKGVAMLARLAVIFPGGSGENASKIRYVIGNVSDAAYKFDPSKCSIPFTTGHSDPVCELISANMTANLPLCILLALVTAVSSVWFCIARCCGHTVLRCCCNCECIPYVCGPCRWCCSHKCGGSDSAGKYGCVGKAIFGSVFVVFALAAAAIASVAIAFSAVAGTHTESLYSSTLSMLTEVQSLASDLEAISNALQAQGKTPPQSLQPPLASLQGLIAQLRNGTTDAYHVATATQGSVGIGISVFFALVYMIIIAAPFGAFCSISGVLWACFGVGIAWVSIGWLMFGLLMPLGKIIATVCPLLPIPDGDSKDFIQTSLSPAMPSRALSVAFLNECVVKSHGDLIGTLGLETSIGTNEQRVAIQTSCSAFGLQFLLARDSFCNGIGAIVHIEWFALLLLIAVNGILSAVFVTGAKHVAASDSVTRLPKEDNDFGAEANGGNGEDSKGKGQSSLRKKRGSSGSKKFDDDDLDAVSSALQGGGNKAAHLKSQAAAFDDDQLNAVGSALKAERCDDDRDESPANIPDPENPPEEETSSSFWSWFGFNGEEPAAGQNGDHGDDETEIGQA